MKTRGAVVRGAPGKWDVVDIELDEPRQDELLIKMVASGLCHSDDHITSGDIPVGTYPMCGGHEGSGIVEKVGPNTPGWEVGDHVVLSFLPGCGRCRWCASGMQNLCDSGANLLFGNRLDGSYRMTVDGQPVGQMCGISTFAAHSVVATESAVKVAKDLPLEKACLVGCGVGTGFGSAENSAQVRPGDTVIVMGIGGIGINAVQGAALAGAKNVIAIDPLANKREKAMELGATHAFESAELAMETITNLTRGQMADSAILTPGLMTSEIVSDGFNAVGKGGKVVLTGLNKLEETNIQLPGSILTLFRKELRGSLFGDCNPTVDIPRILGLYQSGDLKLDEILTRTYTLDEVNEGYDDLLNGKNVRGVVVHEH